MKSIQYVTTMLLVLALKAPAQTITLSESINAALNNKASIASSKSDAMIAALQTKAEFFRYFPQLSVSYDYRYYATRPSQIIPVGLFSEVPTDEKRAIQFGTPWQQSAGITFYQPLIDLSIKSRISESRINERISNENTELAEMELKSEVMKSYTRIWILTSRVKSAELDTARSSLTLALFRARLSEGQISSTDLNRAQIIRNNAIIALGQSNTELIKEKLYFGFITGISIDRLLADEYDFSVFEGLSGEYYKETDWDFLPEVTRLRIRAELIGRQIASERNKYLPRLGLEGFLGANQYSFEFDPLKNTSWYGTSYLGLNIRLPIITGENKVNRIRQLKLQTGSVNAQINDLMSRINTTNMQLAEEIMQLEGALAIIEQNVALLNANFIHYQARMNEGQSDADEILGQQTELKKEIERLNETKAGLALRKIEMIVASGRTDSFIGSLKQ